MSLFAAGAKVLTQYTSEQCMSNHARGIKQAPARKQQLNNSIVGDPLSCAHLPRLQPQCRPLRRSSATGQMHSAAELKEAALLKVVAVMAALCRGSLLSQHHRQAAPLAAPSAGSEGDPVAFRRLVAQPEVSSNGNIFSRRNAQQLHLPGKLPCLSTYLTVNGFKGDTICTASTPQALTF